MFFDYFPMEGHVRVRKEFNKNYRKWFMADVLAAIKKYALIEPGERICVALSGGKDSAALLQILWLVNRYSWLKFDLSALHVRTADYDTGVLKALCKALEVPYIEALLDRSGRPERGASASGAVERPIEESLIDAGETFGKKIPEGGQIPEKKTVCYICSRLKRGAISDALRRNGIRKVAYGHHADDAAETLFMNLLYNGKLGSFSPRVGYDDNPMQIIRPLIYISERTITKIHSYMGLPLLDYKCPHEERNVRYRVKQGLAKMDALFGTRNFSEKVVAALENVDPTNNWQDLT